MRAWPRRSLPERIEILADIQERFLVRFPPDTARLTPPSGTPIRGFPWAVRAGSQGASGRVSHFDVQALSEDGECRLDLVKPGVMPEGEQPVNVCLGYSDPARKFRF